MRPRLIVLVATLALAGIGGGTFAQDKGTLDPVPLPPLAHPEAALQAARRCRSTAPLGR
jgi:hypothetical protein